MAGAPPRFRIVDFLLRWMFTFALMLAIYNPTGYSYVEWLLTPDSEYVPLKIFVGMTMLSALWFLYAMAMRAMQTTGAVVGAVVLASAAWALDNLGLLPRSWMFLVVMGQAGLAAWLAAGLSLVFVRQQASGLLMSSDEH